MSDRQHQAASNGTCPALTLPVEITSEIFLRCVSTAGPANPLNNPPILLTKICRDWRLIVLSMPKLWNDICLPEFRGRRGPRPGYIDSWWVSQLGTWLFRAQDEPLTMAIIANMNHPDPDESLVELLDSHRQRWQDLNPQTPI
ncbi:hypothetical protein B0H14DRAFT_1489317 [Mycena olivaceomarginata]|nr:hypothetical protein B0H14DRAFT_1489317 [Mycena olivaceomarginata]